MKKKKSVKWIMLFVFYTFVYSVLLSKIYPEKCIQVISRQTVSDFSSIHGEGYSFDGELLTITDRNAYFILDIGNQKRKYYDVEIQLLCDTHFNDNGEIQLGHSSSGNESDMIVVPGNAVVDDENITIQFDDSFSHRQYLRFCFHDHVGESFHLVGMKQGYRWFAPGILYSGIILALALFSLLLSFFVADVNRKWNYPLKFLNHTVKTKYKWAIMLSPQFVFLIWLFVIHGLFFTMNDDVIIRDISNGYCGKYSVYLCSQISPLFGGLILLLNKICPLVNWLTILYISIMMGCMLLIDALILKKSNTIIQTLFASISALVAFQFLWFHFTFTIVSFSGVIAGMIGITYLIEYESYRKKLLLTISIVLLFLGVCIRPWTLYLIIIVFSFFALYQCIRERSIKVACVYGGSVVSVFFFGYVNRFLLYMSSNQYSYWLWNKARSGVGDYLSYDSVIATGVWSEAATRAFFGCTLWDNNVYSTDNFNAILSLIERKPLDVSRLRIFLSSLCSDALQMPNAEGLLWLMLLLIVTCFIYKERNNIITISFALGTILAEVACFVWGRYPYRVLMPIIVAGILAILVFGNYGNRKRYYVALPLIVVVMCFSFNSADYYHDGIDISDLEAYNYLDKHDENLYLMATPQMYNLPLAESAFIHHRNGKKNLIGNWDTYSDSYYNLMDCYENVDGSKTLAENIVQCDNVYLLTDHDSPVAQYLLDFLCESTGQNVDAVLYEQIEDTKTYGTIDVWKIVALE